MGAVIPIAKKRKMLDFVKKNINKLSQREMARRLGIGKTTVNRWCVEKFNFHPTKHSLNHHYFDRLDNVSTYILGFIFADGNVSWNPKKSYRALTITASAKDKNHLERIRRLMEITKPLTYSKSTNSYRLIANSKYLCKKLMSLGVVPKKTLKVKFPDYIPNKQLKHFIRGVIDGDGNVRYVDRKRSPYFEITVASGSKDFLVGMRNKILDELKISATPRNINGNTFVLQYTCKRAKKLGRWIYSDANIYLRRKFLEYRKSRGGNHE